VVTTMSGQRLRTAGALVVAAALAIPLSLGAALPATAAEGPDADNVVINEAFLAGGSANQPYANKFVELYNPTDTTVSLDGWSLQYKSKSGARFTGVTPLSGTIAPEGYFLIGGNSNGANGTALPTTDSDGAAVAWGGTDGVLALSNQTGALTLPKGSVIDEDAAGAGIVDLLGYGTGDTYEVAAATAGTSNSDPGSLQRAGYSDNNSTDFTFSTEVTPQSASGDEDTPTDPTDPTPPSDPGAVTPIADIQGTGPSSSMTGQMVTTQGVVTATYPAGTGSLNGYVIQTPNTSGDPADDATPGASDAVFVFSAPTAGLVRIGDSVRLTGQVAEYHGLTQLTVPNASDLTVLTGDDALGTVIPLDTTWPASAEDREALESLLIQPAGDYTVSNTYSANQYGEVGLASGDTPLIQPTDAARPGSAEATQIEADNAARAVTLDDAQTTNFLNAANSGLVPSYISIENPVRVGAAVTFDEPVIADYRNDTWTFNPTAAIRDGGQGPVSFQDTRTAAPAAVGGDIRIATFNVLNYFTTLGADVPGCTSSQDRAGNGVTVNTCPGNGPRGAWDAASLRRQQDKIVAAVNAVDADVVGLLEIENSAALGETPDEALTTLVDALNSAAGQDRWAAVSSSPDLPDVSEQDVITNALIYQPATVAPVGKARARRPVRRW